MTAHYSKLLAIAIFAFVIANMVAGCSDSSATKAKTDTPESRAPLAIGITYAMGGKGDLTYNDAASRGATRLRELGYAVKEYEPASFDDYSNGLELLALGNLQTIFCVGFLYDAPVVRLAASHPDTLFVVLDGAVVSPSNVASVKFNAQEGSVLVGAVAGALTKRKQVAFIGGADIPIINEFLRGFADGVSLADPKVKVNSFYVGSGGAAFTDPVKGREIGLTAINGGNDVLFHAAGSSGNGVIKAAKEKRVLAIGVDVDQSHLAPGTVVTSMLKNFDVAMALVVQKVRAGEHIGGQNLLLGVREGAVSLAPMSKETEVLASAALSIARSRISDQEQSRRK